MLSKYFCPISDTIDSTVHGASARSRVIGIGPAVVWTSTDTVPVVGGLTSVGALTGLAAGDEESLAKVHLPVACEAAALALVAFAPALPAFALALVAFAAALVAFALALAALLPALLSLLPHPANASAAVAAVTAIRPNRPSPRCIVMSAGYAGGRASESEPAVGPAASRAQPAIAHSNS